MIKVDVVYAVPHKAVVMSVDVAEGTSAEQVVLQSGILDKCADIDPTDLTLGIWNRTVKGKQAVKEGDRIEIYRPLIADPKDARRQRAEKAKDEGRANKITGGRA
ncbi:RnfH family protein [Pseudoalteromonas aurantia]|uniref:UPF0125 protein CWC20_06035 n=1 Tax=Pseudoalteromonas aurantia TaxID=43654 RepID=A0ABY2VZX5_9GAMM|nr:RnfH family protein [Pseudoalteromonas aurantia]TMO76282.1 RnfH family protein [Pseudoalteromonas aurantia]